MCVSLKRLWKEVAPVPTELLAPCGQCWRCRSNELNDVIGRCLCEAFSADWSLALTLTYRDQADLAHKVVRPDHAQDFIRALRDRRHVVRYFIAGEYGETKGRAHFHALLFGFGRPLEGVAQRERSWIDAWPHGHVFGDWGVDRKSARYAVKYLLKDLGGQWDSRSKVPVLGTAFAREFAREYVRHGIVPRTLNYMPPGGRTGVKYALTGAAEREFMLELSRHRPEWLNLDEDDGVTKWYAGAARRARKWLHNKRWDALTTAERDDAIVDKMGPLAELMAEQRRREALETYMGRLWRQKVENRYGQAGHTTGPSRARGQSRRGGTRQERPAPSATDQARAFLLKVDAARRQAAADQESGAPAKCPGPRPGDVPEAGTAVG